MFPFQLENELEKLPSEYIEFQIGNYFESLCRLSKQSEYGSLEFGMHLCEKVSALAT
jgi:hypothetical protein